MLVGNSAWGCDSKVREKMTFTTRGSEAANIHCDRALAISLLWGRSLTGTTDDLVTELDRQVGEYRKLWQGPGRLNIDAERRKLAKELVEACHGQRLFSGGCKIEWSM